MINELKLFQVKNDSGLFPIFYVSAPDILKATEIAQKIIDSLNNKRTIGTVQAMNIPLLEWEDD